MREFDFDECLKRETEKVSAGRLLVLAREEALGAARESKATAAGRVAMLRELKPFLERRAKGKEASDGVS